LKDNCPVTENGEGARLDTLCRTELDICKENLIKTRMAKSACTDSAGRLDDKNLELSKTVKKEKKDKEKVSKTVDKVLNSTIAKESQVRSLIKDSLKEEEKELSSILKQNGINVTRKEIDDITSFQAKKGSKKRKKEKKSRKSRKSRKLENEGETLKEKDGDGTEPEIQVKLVGNHSSEAKQALGKLLPRIFQALPKSFRPMAQRLGSEIQNHQNTLKVLDSEDESTKTLKRRHRQQDHRPSPESIIREVMPHLPFGMPIHIHSPGSFFGSGFHDDDDEGSNSPFASMMPQSGFGGHPFFSRSPMVRMGGPTADEDDEDEDQRPQTHWVQMGGDEDEPGKGRNLHTASIYFSYCCVLTFPSWGLRHVSYPKGPEQTAWSSSR